MPKRATHTFESEKDGVKDVELNVHYCMCCGESVLILGPGVTLSSLPRRKTDGAYVLERGSVVAKLKTQPGESKLLKRQGGFERQYRLNCWNCNVPIAYRAEDSDTAPLTYVMYDATGLQADLYLQLYQVPPCIQGTGERSVRVAMEVQIAQPKKAITHVNNGEVGISVCATAQEGLANAEVLDTMQKVLGCLRSDLQLSRGWSLKSKFLLVSNMAPVDVFKAIRGAVETDLLPLSMQGVGPGDGTDVGPAATAGAASSVARQQWEQSEELEELAAAPTLKQQTFRN
mmetsp:Transcript_4293/g.7062  ORF Transcript_4293/g.7062 Transcript_4293/m.7062 type:complete len:287 (+) Transcript_4293:104-964(+)